MKNRLIFSALFMFVIIIWVSYPFIVSWQGIANFFPKANWASRGVIGDSFGALNTLFSGLALAGLAVNIYLQSAQLKKLELKEEANAVKIDSHAETLKFTALLHYYNSEADRITNLILNTHGRASEKSKDDLIEKFSELNKARSEIVKKLKG